MADPADGFTRLLEILDRMEIPYSIAGSAASSEHGIPRTTMDIDLVADLKAEQVEEFASLLQADFYADAAMMRKALERGRAFNVIHYASAYKFDIFPLQNDEYSRTEFARRSYREIRTLGEPIECQIATAEDTILRKLDWYRRGGETSDRQWSDLRGVVRISGASLDLAYLGRWAKYLKVDDLLERLLAETAEVK